MTAEGGGTPPARRSLLDAGADLVNSRRTGEVLPGVREVCQRAGRSTAVFYSHFASLAAYHDALVDHLLTTDVAFEVMAKTMDLLAEVTQKIPTAPASDIPRLIASIAAANIGAQLEIGMPDFRTRLLLQATAKDQAHDQAQLALRRLYEHVTDVQVVGYDALLSAWRREPRPPYDLRTIAITITAVADGLLVRRGFQPDLDVITLFEDAVRSLIPTLTRRVGQPDDLDEALRRSYDPRPPARTELPAASEQDPSDDL